LKKRLKRSAGKDWRPGAGPFFVAEGKVRRKGKKRIAAEFRKLKPWVGVVNYPMPTMDDLINVIPRGCLYISTIHGACLRKLLEVEIPENCLTIRGPRSGCWYFKPFPLRVCPAVALLQRWSPSLERT